MVKLDVINLMKKHNMSKYRLHIQLGMSYQNFNKMINNETRSIRYETIDTLCAIFQCTPNDLFLYDPDKLQNE